MHAALAHIPFCVSQTEGLRQLQALGLESVPSRKFVHQLRLPECSYFRLWRADDVERLAFLAPKLDRLDLQVQALVRACQDADPAGNVEYR